MALRKTALALPQDLLVDIDRRAARRGESRNAYITRILRAAANTRRDRDIMRRLDELFADEELARDQVASAEELDAIGTDWSHERW
jgi:hypothetical protein